MRRPRSSFFDWMRESRKKDYVEDIGQIALLLEAIASKKTLEIDMRLALLERALKVLDKRRKAYYYRMQNGRRSPRFWDGRNWRGYNAIVDALRK